MGKVVWHPVTRRFVELEARTRMLEERNEAMQMVLAWLLSRHPDDDVFHFLACQANTLDTPETRSRFLEAIALLDELRADVDFLRGERKKP
jgi:hypothetical protein